MEEGMLSAADVMRRLKVSRSYAYKLISRLNCVLSITLARYGHRNLSSLLTGRERCS